MAELGRRTGPRSQWPQGRGGSTPPPGTKQSVGGSNPLDRTMLTMKGGMTQGKASWIPNPAEVGSIPTPLAIDNDEEMCPSGQGPWLLTR